MIKVEKSIVIARPVEEVFAYVADQRHAPQWQHGLLEVRLITDGPLRVGTRHAFVRKFMGRRMEAENEYVAFEPNRLVTFRFVSGPIPGEASYLAEPVASGTKLTSRIEMEASGFASLAEPLIAASLRREMEAGFGELKDLLENQVVPSPIPVQS